MIQTQRTETDVKVTDQELKQDGSESVEVLLPLIHARNEQMAITRMTVPTLKHE